MAAVVVLGAGIAGVLAARQLVADGHDVTVVDKGYRPGGRMATRTIDDARFDHGAQFFTARDDRFLAVVDAWFADAAAARWFTGSPDPGGGDGHARYCGTDGMRSLVEHLAADLPDLRTSTRVDRIEAGERWRLAATTADETVDLAADALLVTAPAPQTITLLGAGHVLLPGSIQDALAGVRFDPCIAVLAVPDGDVTLPNRGALRLGGEPIEWLADNRAKGISDGPSVTIHAGPETSRTHLEDDLDEVGEMLAAAAASHLGTTLDVARVHRWRYSRPTSAPVPDGYLVTTQPLPIAFAGDGLAGGRVEGAALSGMAAGSALSRAVGG